MIDQDNPEINPWAIAGMASVGLLVFSVLAQQYKWFRGTPKKKILLKHDEPIRVVRGQIPQKNQQISYNNGYTTELFVPWRETAQVLDETVSKPKVQKRYQVQPYIDIPKNVSSSSKPASKPNYFRGIMLGEHPEGVENRIDGIKSYFYLDTVALDQQAFDYSEFQTISRMKMALRDKQPGLVRLNSTFKLRWALDGVEQPVLDVNYELKILQSKDRVLCVEIPGEGATLIMGVVAAPGGLHTPEQNKRMEERLRKTVFTITQPEILEKTQAHHKRKI